MGSGIGDLLKVIASNFDVLAGNLLWLNLDYIFSKIGSFLFKPIVSLVYPLYASIRAIETKSPEDDRQWLTYWILYSMITLFELTFAWLIEWIPFWSYMKLIATCWLVIPYFSGAAYVYEYLRPMFLNPQTVNIWYMPGKKKIFNKPDDILAVAEKYIAENGPEAFENLITKAETGAKSRNSNYVSYSDSYTY